MHQFSIAVPVSAIVALALAGVLTFAVAEKAHAYKLCPDGSYVGGDRCTMTPDGGYVGGNSYELTPDGGYVGTYRQRNRDWRNSPDDWYERY